MSEVPEFVRQRLARPAAGEHPDADVLTAFAENSLSQQERDQVLGHLSWCAACRDVAALALPELDQQPAAPAAARHLPWLRWPMLRWAGAAAAVVIVAAAVSLRHTEPQKRTLGEVAKVSQSQAATNASAPMTANEVPAPPAKDLEQPKAKDAPEAKPGSVGRLTGKPASPLATPIMKPATPGAATSQETQNRNEIVAGDEIAPSGQHAFGFKKQLDTKAANGRVQTDGAAGQAGSAPAGLNNIHGEPLAQQKLPTSSQEVASAVSGYGPAQAKQAPSLSPQAPATAKMKTETQPAEAGKMDRADAQNVVPQAADTAVLAREEPAKGRVVGGDVGALRRVSSSTSWRISTEGALERSLDGGNTWRPVPVHTPVGFSETTYATAGFRAVSAVGQQVWVAGARGALYRSDNGGTSWTRLTPRTQDRLLVADVVRVEFTDAQHGTLTTDNGELWTTSDGGASWTVRRP